MPRAVALDRVRRLRCLAPFEPWAVEMQPGGCAWRLVRAQPGAALGGACKRVLLFGTAFPPVTKLFSFTNTAKEQALFTTRWPMPRSSPRSLAPAPAAKRPPRGTQGPRPRVDTAPTRDRQHRAPPRRRPPLPAVRPAGPGGWRRPGRLHAPEAARTGPVSASRRSHVLMPRGGAGSTGKWPLTGFLAGPSVNWAWVAIPTDL